MESKLIICQLLFTCYIVAVYLLTPVYTIRIIATRSVAFVEYTRKLQSDPARPAPARPGHLTSALETIDFASFFSGPRTSQPEPARVLLRASHCGVFSALLRLKMVDFAYQNGL